MVTATRGTTTVVTGSITLTERALTEPALTEPVPERGGRWPRKSAAILTLVGTAILLSLSVPRTIEVFSMLPGDPVLDTIQRGVEVPSSDLEDLASSREAALGWIESGRAWTDLGLAQVRLAERAGLDGGRRLLDESVTSLRRGLALAPANSFAWARLAYAELGRRGPSTTVTEALKMSMLTASYEPRLLFSRLDLCLLVWRRFDEEGRALVAQQIRYAWEMSRPRLARLAQRRNASRIVADALAAVPKDVNDFSDALNSL